jgi:hypothetical protein
MLRKRVKMALWLAGMVLSLVLLALSGSAIKFHRDYQSITSEHLIGNRISNATGLKEKEFPFFFSRYGRYQGD